MTGVGGRPELIIEGSNNAQMGWKEYNFLYKPGQISKSPPVVGAFCSFLEILLVVLFQEHFKILQWIVPFKEIVLFLIPTCYLFQRSTYVSHLFSVANLVSILKKGRHVFEKTELSHF